MAGRIGLATKNFCGRYFIHNSKWFDSLVQQPTVRTTSLNYCLPRYLSVSRQDGRPKKPATHFLLYYKSVQDVLDKKIPDRKMITDKVKIASQMYKELSPEEKEALEEKSQKLLMEYKEKLEKWQGTLSPEEMDIIKTEKKEKREKKAKRKITKLQRDNAKPKQSSSAFLLYSIDQLKRVNLQSMSSMEKLEAVRKNMSDCSKKWKDLPAGEKEVYNKKAAEERELYELEMQQWELNMIEQGKKNLIRKKTLADHQREEKKAAKEAEPKKEKAKKETDSGKKMSSKTEKTKEVGQKDVKK